MPLLASHLDPPAPCGYCRRCAIHDDPGGCLVVADWARRNPELDRLLREPWAEDILEEEEVD